MSKSKLSAFGLSRQPIGIRMLQLPPLPLATMDKTALQMALADIAER